MGELRASAILILCVLITTFLLAVGDDAIQQNNKKAQEIIKPTLSDRLRNTFSLSTNSPATGSYWEKVKTMAKQSHGYFFPPTIDFRGDEVPTKGVGGAGEKAKEAVSNSLGKGKATIEGSAKSAANLAGEAGHTTANLAGETVHLAGETLHNTAEKVKRSFSAKKEAHEEEL